VADGIRLQLSAERRRQYGSLAGQMVILRDVARPIPPHPTNPVCRVCRRPHECKTYHFQLDAEGTIMVSTTIWENLLRMPDHGGFEPINVVTEPPAQGIILPPARISVTPAQM
jgi:hypothetical protein